MKKYLALLGVLGLVTSCSEVSSKPLSGSTSFSEVSSPIVSTSVLSTSGLSQTSSQEYPEYAGYTLGWHDEFDGPELGDDWEHMIGDGSSYGIWRWGNNEQQFYLPKNTTVEDGNLVITARREDQSGYAFTSSRLRTYGKVSALYGRIEARISLPVGNGLWPAFWMLPESPDYGGWPTSGEIDIMENRGRQKDITSGALHFDLGTSNEHQYISNTAVLRNSTIADYHVYALEWTAEAMRWYVDDNNFMTVTNDKWKCSRDPSNTIAPFDKPFHILLNLAVGGNFDGGLLPDDSFESAQMKVDYVRIYEPLQEV